LRRLADNFVAICFVIVLISRMTLDLALRPPALRQSRPAQPRARLVAFYLPQFHPIPENDEFWGKNFTEWTNVRKARPLFPGHNQPRRPGPLGYYDLRDPAIREAQAALAKDAGIEAFCYWHYWFGAGRRLLERPFEEVLQRMQPDFPFCLCWANESWTGIWHGAPNRLMIEQTYPGPADHSRHFRTLLPAFRDPRYLRVDSKPVFLVYRPENLPDSALFTAQWRNLAACAGLPGLHLIGMGDDAEALAPFDATLPYGPRDFLRHALRRRPFIRAGTRLFSGRLAQNVANTIRLPWLPARYDFAELVVAAFNDAAPCDRAIPCVLAGWDNTPRAGRRGIVLQNFSPRLFGAYLEKALAQVAHRPAAEKLVFIKAWNEWAEGNFLEPDEDLGTALLDTIRETVFARP
jgi:hypothetical protein